MGGHSNDLKVTRAISKFALAREGINPKDYNAKDCKTFATILSCISRKNKLKELEMMSRVR